MFFIINLINTLDVNYLDIDWSGDISVIGILYVFRILCTQYSHNFTIIVSCRLVYSVTLAFTDHQASISLPNLDVYSSKQVIVPMGKFRSKELLSRKPSDVSDHLLEKVLQLVNGIGTVYKLGDWGCRVKPVRKTFRRNSDRSLAPGSPPYFVNP